jgi:hypothetical protein
MFCLALKDPGRDIIGYYVDGCNIIHDRSNALRFETYKLALEAEKEANRELQARHLGCLYKYVAVIA